MFARQEVVVQLPREVVSVRLVHLMNSGALRSVSETAYEGGREMLVRVGPFGDLPGLSKLVRVHVLAPVRRGAAETVSMRWEASGPAGELFPVLDGDLTLTADGDGRCRLSLVGSYRPPLGRAGAAVDRAFMNRVATATLHAFLDNLAGLLAAPAAYSVVEQGISRPRPAAEPGQA